MECLHKYMRKVNGTREERVFYFLVHIVNYYLWNQYFNANLSGFLASSLWHSSNSNDYYFSPIVHSYTFVSTQLIERISSEYKSQVMSYDEESSDLVNLIQEVLQCCGADNFVIEYRSFTQVRKMITPILSSSFPSTCICIVGDIHHCWGFLNFQAVFYCFHMGGIICLHHRSKWKFLCLWCTQLVESAILLIKYLYLHWISLLLFTGVSPLWSIDNCEVSSFPGTGMEFEISNNTAWQYYLKKKHFGQ